MVVGSNSVALFSIQQKTPAAVLRPAPVEPTKTSNIDVVDACSNWMETGTVSVRPIHSIAAAASWGASVEYF